MILTPLCIIHPAGWNSFVFRLCGNPDIINPRSKVNRKKQEEAFWNIFILEADFPCLLFQRTHFFMISWRAHSVNACWGEGICFRCFHMDHFVLCPFLILPSRFQPLLVHFRWAWTFVSCFELTELTCGPLLQPICSKVPHVRDVAYLNHARFCHYCNLSVLSVLASTNDFFLFFSSLKASWIILCYS